ncbi:MAG: ATP-binding protein [Lachnospiraceae bacterium]|nr:ATP-binding protein [Lachnospiraceae bacterium]
MMEITLPATIENVEKVTEFVNAELAKINCPAKAKAEIDIAIDELFSNIANYAYNPEIGKATVKVEVQENPQAVVITFMDKGIPYDPLKREDPNVKLSADERGIGGLGIFMVKKTMDSVEYEYKDNHNILKIKKNI